MTGKGMLLAHQKFNFLAHRRDFLAQAEGLLRPLVDLVVKRFVRDERFAVRSAVT